MGFDFIKNYGGQRTIQTANKRTSFAEINGVQLKQFLAEYEKMHETGLNGVSAELSAGQIKTIGEQIEMMKFELEMRRKTCNGHTSKLGDNYGISCALCGKQIAGYGYGGHYGVNLSSESVCIHDFISDGAGKSCRYCEVPEKNK